MNELLGEAMPEQLEAGANQLDAEQKKIYQDRNARCPEMTDESLIHYEHGLMASTAIVSSSVAGVSRSAWFGIVELCQRKLQQKSEDIFGRWQACEKPVPRALPTVPDSFGNSAMITYSTPSSTPWVSDYKREVGVSQS
jgi:hypothetical protein